MTIKTSTKGRVLSLFLTILTGTLPITFLNATESSERPATSKFMEESNEEIRSRLHSLENIVDIQINERVRHFMGSYLVRGRKSAERILGRSSIYFPVIEKYLALYNIPDQLKYLAVVESGLNPTRTSKAGAAGLWQLMPATARQYGIRINSQVDERLDVNRSTEVAIRYLSELYSRYNDWTLAIAAYNCGPGRVDRELKKTAGIDFGSIKYMLPKETQRYVEKFIAVNYAISNYLFYDLHPNYPDYSLQMTEVTTVYHRLSFEQIAAKSGIALAVIRQLNPSYIQNLIPDNRKGYYLVLPQWRKAMEKD